MKNKLFVVLFLILGLLTITACGKEIVKATITDNQGNVANLNAQELQDIAESNKEKFESLYYKANIDITEEFEKVDTIGLTRCIYLKNGWAIRYDSSDKKIVDVAIALEEGNKVHFSGKIYDFGGYCGTNIVELVSASTIEIIE